MSVIFLLFLSTVLLGACGTRVANSNWPGMAADDAGIVYVAFGPGIVAVDVNEQKQLWFYRPPNSNTGLQFYASPSANDGKLIFGDYGASGGMLNPRVKVSIYALDEIESDNPKQSWVQSETAQDRIIAPPLLVGQSVYVGTADNFVVSLATNDGHPLWDDPFEAGHSIWGQSVYEDGVIYVPSLDKKVYALEAETGAELWQADVGGSVADKPVLNGDLLYVGSFDRQVYALGKGSGEIRWTSPAKAAVWGAPAFADGVVFYVDLNGNAYAVTADTGELIWEKGVADYVVAAPVVNDGVVYIASAGDPNVEPNLRGGALVALSAENGQELWRKTTASPIFTTPVIVDNSIVVAMQSQQKPLTLVIYNLDDPDSSWSFEPEIPGEEG